MPKQGQPGKRKGSARPASGKKMVRFWQGLLALVVVGVLASSYILLSRESSSGTQGSSPGQAQTEYGSASAALRNRLVLPAWPQNPRPVTLNPNDFPDLEVKQAYQVAKEIPEALERIACYCGCYGSAGHRNNLDCFKDNHGVTWILCRNIALEAQRQLRLGTPVSQIKRIVDEKWAPAAR